MSLILAAALSAAFASAASDEPARRLDRIQVVANRQEQPLADALAAVVVLDRAAIEASQASDLADLIRRLPGLDLGRTGGSGQSTSVFVRGGNSNHVLVLIDGVRVASANTGGFAFEQLALEEIERIEYLRGPRAAHYGSDAIGGVLLITTRRGLERSAVARAGRYGRGVLAAGLGLGDEGAGLRLSAGGETYDGFSAQNPQGFSYDPDRDGFEHRHFGARLGFAGEAQRLELAFRAARGETAFDRGESEARQNHFAATWRGRLSQGWQHELILAQARDSLFSEPSGSRFETRRLALDWLHRLELSEMLNLSAGLHGLRERGGQLRRNGTAVFAGRRERIGASLALLGALAPWRYELSLRHEDSDGYGGHSTGQAALGWAFDRGRLYLSAGQGFRAPNFNELFSPGFSGLFAGNPKLRPERSRSLELGIDAEFGRFDLGFRLHRTRLKDLIAFQGPNFQAVNLARAKTEGAELEATTELGGFLLRGRLQYLKAVDEATGLQLLRRARRQAGLGVERRLGDLDLALEGQYVGKRRDFGGDLKSFALWEARAGWRLSPDWRLQAKLGNLFDRDYTLARGFNAPGREWLIGLRYGGE
jgi:vitamin B12 transporter